MSKKEALQAEKEAVQGILDKQQDIVLEEVFDDETSFEEPVIAEEVVVEKVETQKEPIKGMNKNIDFAGRGFATLKDAYEFINTDYFKGLGKVDQEEFKNWLK